MTQAEYDEVSDKALRLFEFGQVSRLLSLLEKSYTCFFCLSIGCLTQYDKIWTYEEQEEMSVV